MFVFQQKFIIVVKKIFLIENSRQILHYPLFTMKQKIIFDCISLQIFRIIIFLKYFLNYFQFSPHSSILFSLIKFKFNCNETQNQGEYISSNPNNTKDKQHGRVDKGNIADFDDNF